MMEDNSEFFHTPIIAFHDDYRVIQQVFSSACGVTEIYLAIKSLKRFAIKALKKEYRDDPVYVSILRKEYEIGIQLDNPHVVRTYAFENIPGLGYCVILEWIDGATLKECIEKNTLSERESLRIADQLCDGIEYLHAHQIVHQDIKPSNVMITADHHLVKIIDFGFADSPTFAAIKQPGGTREYAAPEQIEAVSEEKSHLSDIYSLGKLFHELPLPESKVLESLIDSMLAEEPGERPQSVSEVCRRLHDATSGQGKKADKIRRIWLVALIIFVCITAPLIYFLHFNSKKTNLEPAAVPQKADYINIEVASDSTTQSKEPIQDLEIKKKKEQEKGAVKQIAPVKQIEDRSTPVQSENKEAETVRPKRDKPVHWMILLTGEETMRRGKRYMRKGDYDGWEQKTRDEMTAWVMSQTEDEDTLRSRCLKTIEDAIVMLKE